MDCGCTIRHWFEVWKHALVTYQDVTVQGPEEHPKEAPLLPPRPWDHTLAHLLQQCPFGTIDCFMFLTIYGVSAARHQHTITLKLQPSLDLGQVMLTIMTTLELTNLLVSCGLCSDECMVCQWEKS